MRFRAFFVGLLCCAGSVAVAAVPAAVDGTITIDGVVEATDSADAAALASASAIVLNSGSTLFYKASDTLALSATVSGTGAFVAVGAGDVTISGDNDGLLAPGHFAFTNTVATIAHEHGLGAAGTGTAYFSHDSTDLYLRFNNGDMAFTNHVALVLHRIATNGKSALGSSVSGGTFFQDADFSISVSAGACDLNLTNGVEFISGTFKTTLSQSLWLRHTGTGSVWFREGSTVDVRSTVIPYFSSLHIGATSFRATGGLNPDTSRKIILERDYVLSEDTYLKPWAGGTVANAATSVYYDLNGHSQNVAYLSRNTSSGYASVRSVANPCVLKTVSTSATGSHTAPFLFLDAISFWKDCATTATFTAPSASTGDLKVTRGTLIMEGSAAWAGDNVTVGGTGTLSCQGANSLATGSHRLSVESGGSLVVGDGVTLRVKSAVFGSVTLEPGDTYTMSAIAAILSDAGESSVSVSGGGSITVLSDWEGWPDVGTATSVTVPKGTVAEIADSDIAKVQALQSIATGSNAEIRITATSPLALSANISGFGVFKAVGGGAVTLSGDNSALVAPGHFEFEDTPVVVASEYALGGKGAAPCLVKTTTANSGAARFSVPAATKTLTNYVDIVMSGFASGDSNFYFGSEAADEYVVQAGSFATVPSSSGSWNNLYLRHNVEFIGASFTMSGFAAIRSESGKTDGVRRIGGETTAVELGNSWYQGIIYISNLHLAPASLTALTGLAPSAANNIIFERDNCLSASTPLAPYANGSGEDVFFNLNGHSQTVGRLHQIGASANNYSVISSDAPATLTAAGAAIATNTVRYRMIGPISYMHDTPAVTTFTQVKLAATGDLTVSDGSVTFADGSGWSGTNVTVRSGGTLNFLSTASLTEDSLHNLMVEAGGALQVADDVTIVVNSATFGSVSLEPLTTYTMDEVRALTAGENVTLTGNGSIRTLARSIPGEWTGWPDVGLSSSAAIPNGVAAEVLDDDIAKVAALSRIDMGIDASIVVKTSGAQALPLTAAIYGTGRIWICGESGTTTNVVLSGDNRGLLSPGGFSFSNTWAVVSSRYGLGGAGTGRAEFYPAEPFASNRSRLTFTGEATTNDVSIKTFGRFTCGYDSVDVTFRQRGDMDLKTVNDSNGRATFFNDFAVVGGTFNSTFTRIDNAQSTLRLVEDCVVSSLNGVFGTAGVLELGPASMSAQWSFAMEQSLSSVRFVKDGVLNNSKGGYLFFYDSSSTTFTFDLNGFSQTAASIYGHQYGNANQAANPDAYSFTVTSAKPATLTLNGTNPHSESVKVIDQASLTYAGTTTQTIGYATSTTAGSLTISSGAIALERNAKWTGGDIVLCGGDLIVRGSAITNTFGTGRETTPNLVISGGSKLVLESDEAIPSVRTATVDGERLDRGVYSRANCGWIDGPGSLRVHVGTGGAILLIR